MPRMNISVPHQLSVKEATKRIKNLVMEFKTQIGDKVTDVNESWVNDAACFSFRILGFLVEGNLYVKASEIRLDGKFPIAALPFKGMVERDIKEKAQVLLS
ncbi:MAG: polyhydroxyalkanoic acid system family protein [Deltaproteobacteria bacterium]|nr:polyhydroxyalkanoic acid system family protein [Deltaproteobacteria bacterium]MBW2265139.1 polyhydroxyalkanoic acid system family protein [Deltaproteobacteria bacterium]MBW2318910.1 polyhydroxyalkanoic acid system family protein [Deltaproteobacteria bacterium]MBW2602219.1 polyhydroxyalkanoic acid system family protein [Deltaproteobacteria bacterium]OEU46610.1 MAG: hypothetical protein BBJ60_06480 [Desulfobacterales bacterium S7086C20]